MNHRRRFHLSSGFTLVELLVVMALLSLLMLGMVSSMRTAAQTEERVDSRLQRLDDFRVATELLRTVLGSVSAYKKNGMLTPGESPFYFSGDANGLYWVGTLPARYGVGGRYHLKLTKTPSSDLLLEYLPWTEGGSPNWGRASSAVVLSGVRELLMEYGDNAVEPPGWSSNWQFANKTPVRLPDRIMVSILDESGPLPPIIVAIRPTPLSGGGASGAPSFGGGGR